MSFRTGRFDQERVSGRLRGFCPDEAAESMLHLDPQQLVSAGKRLVLMDADNTIVLWRSEEVNPEIEQWIAQAKAAGLHICLVSNTRNRERLARLSEKLGVEAAEGKFKPSRSMYQWAMDHFKVGPSETLMIGDQLLTDVFGANRAGIDSVLVKPMGQREFIGTRVNRLGEKYLLSRLAHALEVAGSDDLEVVPHTGFFQRRIVRQFVKFCIVGGSSFIIDSGIRLILMEKVHIGERLLSDVWGEQMLANAPWIAAFAKSGHGAFFPFAATCGAVVAIINSFIWNRSWTFQIKGTEERLQQFRRFFIISGIGLALNVAFSALFYRILPGERDVAWKVATLCAAIVVAFWNFFGQRLYAFRVHRA